MPPDDDFDEDFGPEEDMDKPPKKKEKIHTPRPFPPDEETGGLNYGVKFMGAESRHKPYPVPVFGMLGSHGGAQIDHLPPGPKSAAMTENEVRELLLREGLDTLGMVRELRRILQIGGLEYTPGNIATLVKSQKDIGEFLLNVLDKEGRLQGLGSKGVALQIINQVNMTIESGFQRATEHLEADPVAREAYRAVKVIEAAVVQPLETQPEPKETPIPLDPGLPKEETPETVQPESKADRIRRFREGTGEN